MHVDNFSLERSIKQRLMFSGRSAPLAQKPDAVYVTPFLGLQRGVAPLLGALPRAGMSPFQGGVPQQMINKPHPQCQIALLAIYRLSNFRNCKVAAKAIGSPATES